ncbi:hypothetical protein COLO4_27624 [Corchorus olitorius]|uniref:SET domain-containing protein n=1 Tax=Corchorus olitorius TaxID=93759 RepID=A0A1R3HPW0_9ROSI|nr:hypothetical protein COLO4_27624 [Corchorus olitorius]
MVVNQSPHTVESSLPTAESRGKRLKIATPEKKEEKNVVGQRRVSSRLQAKQKADKELLVKKRVELLDLDEDGARSKKKVVNGDFREKRKLNDDQTGTQNLPETTELKMVEMAAKIDALKSIPSNIVAKSAHIKVKETIRLFNKHYLHFVQEEEKRCGTGAVKVDKKDPKAMIANKGDVGDVKNKSKRPDLKAISKAMACVMIEKNEVLYPEKTIGSLPGIDVGHQFYSRAEMCVVGFHGHWLNGIDFAGQNHKKGEFKNYILPLAVAIVLSGQYEDDLDNAEDVIYTGQGGHDLTGNKRQIRDQVLERGNLALKNCVEQGVPVRVIRGHQCPSSYTGKVYTYDGLYKVVQYWEQKGISGFTVFKYRLRRLEGQPTLTTSQVQFINGRVPKSPSEIQGLVCKDISGGQEDVPIPATNLVDDPPVAPTGKLNFQISLSLFLCFSDYKYCKKMTVAENIKIPTNVAGCNCKGVCCDPKTCACAKLNGSDFPYVRRDGGRLIEAKHVVFECGPRCGCGPSCVNRTSQRGLRYRLEVFRTPKKGWGVRSWDFIPAGAPICEYIGVIRRTEDLDDASENYYILDIDCLQTMRGLGHRNRRQQDASLPVIPNMDSIDEQKSESVPEFCIDAGSSGNVARYINHSCDPNLFIQCVMSAHHDFRLARLVLFAADNIPPMQELTYDYCYPIDGVYGPDGKVKCIPCYCGAKDCRKRLL